MASATVQSEHLRGLNAEQRAAVLHTEGPLLILAGAGTGKTKTIVHRIAHLISGCGVDPSKIVAVTFTNRAADEMRERVRSYIGDQARRITLSTFHSLGVRILREHGTRLGLPKRFAVYSTPDQLAALKTAAGEVSIDDNTFDLKRVLARISDWKTRRVSPEQARQEVMTTRATGTRADAYEVLAADVYPRYDETLRASGAVDFDDLLLLPVQLLETDEEARRALWKRWHYVLIDEYQDTNAVQLELARHLAGSRRNLCVVGDDDQSIYAFRGADIGNILEFERHFPGARVIRLEQNYRSTRRILGAANAVIAGNTARHAKRLRTDNGIGAPIDYIEHEDDVAEADAVAQEIMLRRMAHRLKWGQFAVLYRTNTQARVLEEAFRQRNVPYRVIGGQSFFERKEVADALAYLRVAVNPEDEIALRRIINYPARGIGRTTVLKITDIARESGQPFASVLRDPPKDIGAAAVRAISEFLMMIDEARAQLEEAEAQASRGRPGEGPTPIAQWASAYFDRIGLEDAVRSDPRNAKSAIARVDNLRDLTGSIIRYERRVWDARFDITREDDEPWSPPTLAGALALLALNDFEEEDDKREDEASVALMTLHSAKGLEFSDVFIVGLEEGILPHNRSLEDTGAADALAEERRLLYVGITRARHRLTLSLCRTRRRAGGREERLPSRYLAEIPQDLLNVKSAAAQLEPEQSAALRQNFFAQMKAMLGDTGE